MMFSVPQFIDVEDKIAGPLTWKQLFWFIGMGAVILVEFSLFETGAFFVVAIPTALIFVAFAFYKPNGIPLVQFLFHGVFFLFRPKLAFWERTAKHVTEVAAKKGEGVPSVESLDDRTLTKEKLQSLAAVLDRRRTFGR